MAKPLVVTIAHDSTKDAVKARLKDSMSRIRAEAGAYVSSIEENWRGDAMDFRVAALAQNVTGSIEVDEREVRVVILLPPLLAFLGSRIGSRVQASGLKLLGKE